MINIDTVTWRNFLGYGDYTSTIDLRKCRGVTMIEGEHEENNERNEGDEKFNNSGKTSIIEAIVWGIFGRLTRDKPQNKGDGVINWHTGKNCIVTIDTSDGYQISRMRKFKSMTETIIFKNGEDATKSTSVPVQNFINNTFDINYDTFIRSRVFGQFNSGFMELSDVRMRKTLEWLMMMHHLGPRAKTAKGKIDGCNQKIDTLNNHIERINNEIKIIEVEIENLTDSSNSFHDKIQENINLLEKELTENKIKTEKEIKSIHEDISKKCKERDTLTNFDIEKLSQEWEKYQNWLNNKELFDNNINHLTNEIISIEQSLESPINEEKHISLIKNFENSQLELSKKQKLLSKLTKLSERIKIKIEDDEKFISIDHKPVCSECRQNIPEKYLKSKIEEASARINELSEQYDKSKSNIKKINNDLNFLINKTSVKPQSIDDIRQHNCRIQKYIEQLNDKKTKLQKIKKEKNNIKKLKMPNISIQEAKSNNKYFNTINEVIANQQNRAKKIINNHQTETQKISDKIKKAHIEINPYQELIANNNKKLRKINEEKVSKTKELSKLKTLKNHLNYIKESYSNKRKIKAFWVNELIPEFNEYLNYYQDFFEVTNKVKFNELLSPKMDKWGFHTSSGGECKRIDLSIMFALNDLHISNFGPQSNFMILDEVDGRLDPFTINKLVSLLNDDLINRNDGLTNIFVISHRKEMKDRFPNKIKVKYKQEKSYIING